MKKILWLLAFSILGCTKNPQPLTSNLAASYCNGTLRYNAEFAEWKRALKIPSASSSLLAGGSMQDALSCRQIKSYLQETKIISYSQGSLSDLSLLKATPQLESLKITKARITDIRHLKSTPFLKYLDLSSNQITDVSVLVDLKQLEYVNLNGNPLKVCPKNGGSMALKKYCMAYEPMAH